MEDRKPNVRRLSTLAAFTLSLGTAIGWGSFVITNSACLQEAKPIGSMIGLLIGTLIMIVIAHNYHVMINKCPENGGIYTFIKNSFGAGHALIKEACDLICETFKHSPVFRVGGDEFVVLLEGEGFQNRERLHKQIYEVVERNSHGEGLVISIGMKEYKKAEERTFSDLFPRRGRANAQSQGHPKCKPTGRFLP